MAVVIAPPNGSSIFPPLGHPAKIQGSIRFGGKVAKCACGNGFVGIVHTVRLDYPILLHALPPSSRPGIFP